MSASQSLEEIRRKCLLGEVEFSLHAVERMTKRGVFASEIVEALHKAECIEEYPDDKYGASMLLLGLTSHQRPLHILVTAFERPLVKIITLYEPDPEIWENLRKRKD